MTDDQVLELEMTTCAIVLQPSGAESTNSDQTQDSVLQLAIWFSLNESSDHQQEVSRPFVFQCGHFEPKTAWVHSETLAKCLGLQAPGGDVP